MPESLKKREEESLVARFRMIQHVDLLHGSNGSSHPYVVLALKQISLSENDFHS